jgi:hypothetical protein
MVFSLFLQQHFRLAAVTTIVAAILIPVKSPHELLRARSGVGNQIHPSDNFNIALKGFRKRC